MVIDRKTSTFLCVAETSEADHLRATAVLNRLQPRRSLILWITDLAETAMRPEVIDGATQLLKRHVLLFVAMAQPEVGSNDLKSRELYDQPRYNGRMESHPALVEKQPGKCHA